MVRRSPWCASLQAGNRLHHSGRPVSNGALVPMVRRPPGRQRAPLDAPASNWCAGLQAGSAHPSTRRPPTGAPASRPAPERRRASPTPRSHILPLHGRRRRLARRPRRRHHRQLHDPPPRRFPCHRPRLGGRRLPGRHERQRRDGRLPDAAVPDPRRRHAALLAGAGKRYPRPARASGGPSVPRQRRRHADDVLPALVRPGVDRSGQHFVHRADGADGNGSRRPGGDIPPS